MKFKAKVEEKCGRKISISNSIWGARGDGERWSNNVVDMMKKKCCKISQFQMNIGLKR